MKQIFLSKGYVALVSPEDYEYVTQYRWYTNKDVTGKVYACRYAGGKRIYMHRELTKCPAHLVVDHINANSLDNRRENMRVCNKKENQHNRRGYGYCKYKGVSMASKTTFRARIYVCPEVGEISLGVYKTADAAALAYDAAALMLFGDYAWLNFPIPLTQTQEAEHEIPF